MRRLQPTLSCLPHWGALVTSAVVRTLSRWDCDSDLWLLSFFSSANKDPSLSCSLSSPLLLHAHHTHAMLWLLSCWYVSPYLMLRVTHSCGLLFRGWLLLIEPHFLRLSSSGRVGRMSLRLSPWCFVYLLLAGCCWKVGRPRHGY
jgi:hypothetical protein